MRQQSSARRHPAPSVEQPRCRFKDEARCMVLGCIKHSNIAYSPDGQQGHLDALEIETEAVNSPPHYSASPSGVECIQITEHMNFNVGNAVKYLWRAGLKGKHLEDIQKARWYVDREIQRLSARK